MAARGDYGLKVSNIFVLPSHLSLLLGQHQLRLFSFILICPADILQLQRKVSDILSPSLDKSYKERIDPILQFSNFRPRFTLKPW